MFHTNNNERNVTRQGPIASYRFAVLVSTALLFSFLNLPLAQAAGDDSGSKATLPAGTRIMVTTVDTVDSEKSQPGQRFRGSLEADLMAGDVVVAPKGTTVFGRLIAAESAGARSGGRLEFDLTDIVIDGQTYSLATSSNEVQGQNAGSQSSTGAKTGAAVGAVAGGMSGAIRGAGAGVVASKVSQGNTQGETVKIPAGTLVEFTLDRPLSLPVAAK